MPVPQLYLDRLTYITPDNVEYMLSAPVFVLQEDGFGMPPIEWVTERGPFQHGETVKDFFLRPRTVQLVVRRNGCSRAEYWNIRNTLLDILRPGRGPLGRPRPGTLRKYTANGAVRELQAYPSEGPGFPSRGPDVWDQYSVQDTLRFTCYDPIAKDPKIKSTTFSAVGSQGVFPITFPFQTSSFGSNTTVQYAGTWLSYPTVILNGPLNGPIVRNLTTGEKIQLDGSIASGRTVTIDLTFGTKTVTLDDGTNMIGLVSADSDLATFHLTPGVNLLSAFSSGTASGSNIVLQWYERYIGL